MKSSKANMYFTLTAHLDSDVLNSDQPPFKRTMATVAIFLWGSAGQAATSSGLPGQALILVPPPMSCSTAPPCPGGENPDLSGLHQSRLQMSWDLFQFCCVFTTLHF